MSNPDPIKAEAGRPNKEKGVLMCADLLYGGKSRQEILQEFTKAYNLSESAIDKWIKNARPIVEERRRADEEIRARVQAEQTEAIAIELGISRKYLLQKWKFIADADPRKLYKDDGTQKKVTEIDNETASAIAAIEVFEERTVAGKFGTTRKIKLYSQETALVEIGKLMSYYPQTSAKVELPVGKGNKDEPKSITVTLNLS